MLFVEAYERATALTWGHADALRREGYRLAVERLQAMSDDPKAPLDDMQRDGVLWALIELQCQAPGEAE